MVLGIDHLGAWCSDAVLVGGERFQKGLSGNRRPSVQEPEMTRAMIAPMEDDGYTLPETLPDISRGRIFWRFSAPLCSTEAKAPLLILAAPARIGSPGGFANLSLAAMVAATSRALNSAGAATMLLPILGASVVIAGSGNGGGGVAGRSSICPLAVPAVTGKH